MPVPARRSAKAVQACEKTAKQPTHLGHLPLAVLLVTVLICITVAVMYKMAAMMPGNIDDTVYLLQGGFVYNDTATGFQVIPCFNH